MKNNKKKVILGQRKPLVKNLLIVDGITRTGKFLLTNLLSGIREVEPVQYLGVLEHICRLQRFGFVDKKAAQELLRAEVDMGCYEMLIGRNINYRKSDKSSIFNNVNYKKYLKRLNQKDGQAALVNFYKNNLFSLFIIHETLPNINIFFNTFPKVKIINIQRSPIDLVYSWHKRKWNQRIGADPLVGEIPLKGKQGPLPWYLYNHIEEYESLSGVDKTILSICSLFKMYQSSYKKLSPKNKKRVLLIYYEDILLNPELAVKTIANFLRKGILPEMKQIIKKEKLPNKEYFNEKDRKIKEIESLSSKKYFKEVLFIEREYFNQRS